MERVLVRTVTDLNKAVAESLDFLDYDFKAKRVWVKPNLLAPHPPEHSVTTDPEIVRAVVHQLTDRGAAAVTVGDNPGGTFLGNMEDFISKTGVAAASEGRFRNIGQSSYMMSLNSRFVPAVPVSPIMKEVDVLINLPVFKTHALTILTGAMKNMFGIVVGGQKTVLHTKAPGPQQFSELIVDIYQAVATANGSQPTANSPEASELRNPPPVARLSPLVTTPVLLHIMDALRGMDGQMGPSGGRVLNIGKLLTARNGVALDSVMALMTGTDPRAIPALRIAAARGLGPIRREELEIIGDFEVIKDFRLPTIRFLGVISGFAGLAYPLLKRRPVLYRERCTQCKRCMENCPVTAISMKPYPKIDRRTCISCFCCAEICPEHALRVPGMAEGAWRNVTRQ